MILRAAGKEAGISGCCILVGSPVCSRSGRVAYATAIGQFQEKYSLGPAPSYRSGVGQANTFAVRVPEFEKGDIDQL